MKKALFLLVAFIATVVMAHAATVTATFTNGQSMEGTLISMTDTTVTLVPIYSVDHKEIVIKPERVRYFSISGIGRYDVVDGKFVPSAKAQAKLDKMQEQKRTLAAADPNQVIAKAFKSTGGVCIGIGIPSAIVGAVLVGIGNSSPDTSGKADEVAAKAKTRANCAAAGYVLLPMGAALTIVGIPLHVHGKRIGELNVNYTGNGAGMSFNF